MKLGDVVVLSDGSERVVSKRDRFSDEIVVCLPSELPHGAGDIVSHVSDVTIIPGRAVDMAGLHFATSESGIEALISQGERDLLVSAGATDHGWKIGGN